MGCGESWKFGGNVKPVVSVKVFMRKNMGLFSNSFITSQSLDDQKSSRAKQNLNKLKSREMVVISKIDLLIFTH
ncbi:hypothetical protein KSP39_PZI010207 [Platanthera zijinensis]|uniref:Uncharacterized protein n=1 Tax=Platanthera zijinensis TaxID=2320716 RepID=A0AAP0BJT2_9ASPA